MIADQFEEERSGEPARDREIGAMLARFESSYATSQIAVARQRYRIGVAARRQVKEQRLHRAPAWMEWTARAASPLPIGIAAALVIAAASVIAFTPSPVVTPISQSATPTSLVTLAASGGTSDQIMDALIAPATSDSLLAAAFSPPSPTTSRP